MSDNKLLEEKKSNSDKFLLTANKNTESSEENDSMHTHQSLQKEKLLSTQNQINLKVSEIIAHEKR